METHFVPENESRLHARDTIDATSYEDAQDRDNPLSNDKKQYEGISSVVSNISLFTDRLQTLNITLSLIKIDVTDEF